MKNILALILIGFCLFCGWLVVESGLFDNSHTIGKSCILLAQTAVNQGQETANAATIAEQRLEAADFTTFGADNAPARSVTLGSIDPKSGFKFELELDSKGAAINKATFSEFDDRDYKNPRPLVILSPVKLPDGSEVLSMANKEFVFVQQQLQLPLDKLSWKTGDVEKATDGSQRVCFEAIIKDQQGKPFVKLTKTYKVATGSYLLDCDLTIENLSASEQKVRFNLTGPIGIGREDPRGDGRKIVGGFITSEGGVVSSRKGINTTFLGRNLGLKDATNKYLQAKSKEDREQAEKFLRVIHKQGGVQFLWIAMTNKYFAAILRPEPDEGKNYCDWLTDKLGWFYNPDGDSKADSGDETIGLNLKIASHTLAPFSQDNSSRAYNFQLYLGPKDKDHFAEVEKQLGQNLGFIETIDFMTCCCPVAMIRPISFGILALMKWMYGFIANYGVVIIILVFLMRLVMHPITKKSQVSMSKMSKLTPKAEEIRKKYANNKAEMNKQLMALYREQGATPIMSMLPMFVQMPIWIALWTAINTSIDLRGKPFLPFWITDLSAPDALFRFPVINLPLFGKVGSFNLLPILMGVAFYLQQKLMPKPEQASANPQVAQQQKMMMIMMPLFFPLVLYTAPSGVNLYIMASTFAGVVEQYVIRKHIREKEEAESKGLVAVTSKTGGKVKKKKPKPFFKT
jgi:YidC/Oxa1 family membrane protein insertase